MAIHFTVTALITAMKDFSHPQLVRFGAVIAMQRPKSKKRFFHHPKITVPKNPESKAFRNFLEIPKTKISTRPKRRVVDRKDNTRSFGYRNSGISILANEQYGPEAQKKKTQMRRSSVAPWASPLYLPVFIRMHQRAITHYTERGGGHCPVGIKYEPSTTYAQKLLTYRRPQGWLDYASS